MIKSLSHVRFALGAVCSVSFLTILFAFASLATAQDPDYYLIPFTATQGSTSASIAGTIISS